MANHSERTRAVRFAPFEMDLIARQLKKNGRKVRLQGQPFDILEHLAFRAKEPVLREDLYHYLSTHNSYDSKHGLHSAIQKIRKALRDSADNPRFVETLRDRGYRFMKDVECVPPVNHDSSHASSSPEDAFLSTLSHLRRELFTTYGSQELCRLFYGVIGLLDQNPEHPDRPEAFVLLERIQAARSQDNLAKHKVSFELASLVLDDANAIRICQPSVQEIPSWYTLARIQKGWNAPGNGTVIVVSHQTSHNRNWILSARKATSIEREIYDQTRKKRN